MRAVGTSPREAKKAHPYVLKLVGLDGKANQFPNQLSGGEQQRGGHRARSSTTPIPSSPTSRPAISTPPARWRS